jgi:hypothetical protein
MIRPIYLLAILLLFFFQSCCILRNKDYPKYSKISEVSKISNSNKSFKKFSEKVDIQEDENSILFVFDADTISLSKSFKEYSCLFSSGLISNQVLGSVNSHSIRIFDIEEVKYCFKGGKLRMFNLNGAESDFFNGFDYYLEIRNKKAHKWWKLEKFVKDAKVTKLATFIQI